MAQSSSPVTGVIDEAMVFLEEGLYQGKAVSDIQELDPDFYTHLVDNKEKGSFSIRRHKDKSFRLHLNPQSL